MNFMKTLALLAVFVAALVTSGSAQISWSNFSPSGVTDDIWCVTYANGTFAAVTNQGKILTSADGKIWNSQSIDPGVWLVSIANGNGTWVAVGAGGTILVSSDLKTWINAKAVTTNRLNGVSYDGSSFLAVGENATVVTSPDGINWTLQSFPAGISGFLHGVTIVPDNSLPDPMTNSAFLVSGSQTNGVNGGVLLTVSVYSNGVAFGSEPYGLLNQGNLEAVATGGGTAVAVGWGGLIAYDNDSSTYGFEGVYRTGYYWSVSPTVTPNVIFRGLTYGNGFFVVAGEQGTIFSSTDGVNWTQRFSGDSPSTLSTATLLSAAYSPTLQRFVVTGTGGTILVSSSPPTVFANVSTRGYVSSTQTFIGGFVIEGTAPRTVLIRGDGPVLSTFGVASPLPDPVITVFNSSGTVVATNTGWTSNANLSDISTAALEVGAFALPNPGNDSALLLTLPPGAYTAQITSAGGNSGIALFEAYTN